ncbi:MAG: ParB/RepB/Spo0J family partition protein [Cytophagales bacterium]|nr:ParB/RepB/Spo0J family partition protein [Armatimonadota bacterium]
MSSVKRVLGRGLADLIPVGGDAGSNGASKDPVIGLAANAAGGVSDAPVATLHPNPRQPRTYFDEAALDELADSITANGILQPILVRPRPTGGYEIVAGERRYRAALKAGLKTIPIIIRELTDAETLALALIENLIREDIGPLETARAFQRLMEDFGWTQEEMGRRVGKSRPAVSNALRLLELPGPIQRSLESGEITEGHARTLLGDRALRETADFRERQERIFRQIVAKSLSVREAERLMRNHEAFALPRGGEGVPDPKGVSRETFGADGSSGSAAVPLAALADRGALEDRLRDALGTQVRISGSDDRGRIEIEYFSPDELDGLLNRLELAFAPKSERITGAPMSGAKATLNLPR